MSTHGNNLHIRFSQFKNIKQNKIIYLSIDQPANLPIIDYCGSGPAHRHAMRPGSLHRGIKDFFPQQQHHKRHHQVGLAVQPGPGTTVVFPCLFQHHLFHRHPPCTVTVTVTVTTISNWVLVLCSLGQESFLTTRATDGNTATGTATGVFVQYYSTSGRAALVTPFGHPQRRNDLFFRCFRKRWQRRGIVGIPWRLQHSTSTYHVFILLIKKKHRWDKQKPKIWKGTPGQPTHHQDENQSNRGTCRVLVWYLQYNTLRHRKMRWGSSSSVVTTKSTRTIRLKRQVARQQSKESSVWWHIERIGCTNYVSPHLCTKRYRTWGHTVLLLSQLSMHDTTYVSHHLHTLLDEQKHRRAGWLTGCRQGNVNISNKIQAFSATKKWIEIRHEHTVSHRRRSCRFHDFQFCRQHISRFMSFTVLLMLGR